MSDDVKIPVSTPGAKEAGAELKNLAGGLREVGQASKVASQDASHATKSIGDDAHKAAAKVKEGAKSWDEWRTGGLAAAAAIGAAIRRVIANMAEASERIRQDYQSFVGLTQQNDTRALAQIRGASEAKTASWMMKQSAAYGIAPEEARTAAFQIESGFQPEQVGGKAALASMEQMAFQTMRATGAGGQTVAGLQIAAYESGLAKTPAQFGAFLAKSTAYAGASRMTLQDFGGIMSRLLPMAVNVGIDPDEFQSMAAAMSFRISDPGRLATSLEQLIRAAGAGPAGMAASEVMAFQSQKISAAMQAGGPQGAKAAAEALGIAPELAQVYGVAFDPTVRARMGTLRAGAAGATFKDVIAGRFYQSLDTPEGRTSRAAFEKKFQESRRAVGEEDYQSALAEAAAGQRESEANREGGMMAGAREAVFTPDQLARRALHQSQEAQLEMLIGVSADPAVRSRAQALLSGISARPLMQGITGVGQRDAEIDAAAFLAEQRGGGGGPTFNFSGGTHYHTGSKSDPAGKPRPAMFR